MFWLFLLLDDSKGLRGGGVVLAWELWEWARRFLVLGAFWCLEFSGAWRFRAEADGLLVFREERGLRFVRDGWVELDWIGLERSGVVGSWGLCVAADQAGLDGFAWLRGRRS